MDFFAPEMGAHTQMVPADVLPEEAAKLIVIAGIGERGLELGFQFHLQVVEVGAERLKAAVPRRPRNWARVRALVWEGSRSFSIQL